MPSLKFFTTVALATIASVTAAFAHQELLSDSRLSVPSPACQQIQESISSSSAVYYPDQPEYEKGIHHWASSSTEQAECVVEPGTPEDVATILNIVGETRTPFGVKGGGHSANRGFSSTTGVMIAMSRFTMVAYNPDTQTVDVGAGNVWDDVYRAVAPHGVNVVGGRVKGIGVAGFVLGGGYSWNTNEYGLALDNVVAVELVKPTGEIAQVDAESDPELLAALKGGLNNFGIVTRFTLRTHPQGEVWGGFIAYTEAEYSALSIATAKFSKDVVDPKASMVTLYNIVHGQHFPAVILFYDGSEPPAGIFDDFLDIKPLMKDIKTREFNDMIFGLPTGDATVGARVAFHTIALETYSESLMNFIAEEARASSASTSDKSGFFVFYAAEPFLPNITMHSLNQSSAYPASRSTTTSYSPFNLYFAWTNPEHDTEMQHTIKESAMRIQRFAVDEGQVSIMGKDATWYPNYALSDTPIERIWGKNLEWMMRVKRRVDPKNIMNLAGGFKVLLPNVE
ncbi:hypothetical protein AX16_002157 [Volvariella volvacea WC 439]|uniref:FAD-binding protein n=1 Tax=Volvariella volvacea TaxID=36659 RepID=M9Z9T9_9AGAR|nr:FAD-binding protein [Volvariella volvacea]KAF8657841.1 hypothetical protein AX16_002157 [Volvariella volvacea WC 439]